MNIKKAAYIAITLTICSMFSICVYRKVSKTSCLKELSIREIAYTVRPGLGYTVYIAENQNMIPYLVLTHKYNDNVLLLRKNLLDERQMFNPNVSGNGYYEDSSIDQFLNKEFINSFSPQMQEKIIKSNITITDRSSIGRIGKGTTDIRRQIFLLSYTELALSGTTMPSVEGKPLKYFKKPDAIIAYHEDLEKYGAGSWWMRTSYTAENNVAWSIGFEGSVGGEGVYYDNGIRPAFCVDKTLRVVREEGILEGETVFVLK